MTLIAVVFLLQNKSSVNKETKSIIAIIQGKLQFTMERIMIA
jgi:hypothetical protein